MIRKSKEDLFRYSGKLGARYFIKYMRTPGFRFMFFHRSIQGSKKRSLYWFLCRYFLRRYTIKYGFQIPPSTLIGGGIYMPHFGGIVINAKAVIGKNCNLAHTVTIGNTQRGELKGVPTIGDYVWIGTGSVIVGGIEIGDNVLIAPNSYINYNVDSNSLCVAGKVLHRENPTKGYIKNVLGESQTSLSSY